MAINILKAEQVKALSKTDDKKSLNDGGGLRVVLKSNGSKVWEFKYTFKGTRRATAFGSYPKVSLAAARKKAKEFYELLENDTDPINYLQKIKEEKKKNERNKIYTVDYVADEFFKEEQKNKHLKDITIQKSKSRLENHFFLVLPKKENTNIKDITYEMTLKALHRLEADDKLETLLKVHTLIVRLLKFAYSTNIIESAELFGKLEVKQFRKNIETKQNPTFTAEADIKRIYSDMLNYNNSLITKYLMIFTIHTAQRQGSIIRAKWSDINLDAKLWIIPKEDMKGTAKTRREHHLPLSDVSVKYLKELYELTGADTYLFPNSQTNSKRNRYPHISNNTVTKALRLMGYTKEEQTAHGFRAMFKSVCKENQEKHSLVNEFVERVLAHKLVGATEDTYIRAKNIEDMRVIVEWWSDFLDRLIEVQK